MDGLTLLANARQLAPGVPTAQLDRWVREERAPRPQGVVTSAATGSSCAPPVMSGVVSVVLRGLALSVVIEAARVVRRPTAAASAA